MHTHEFILDGIVAEVMRKAAPLDYNVPVYSLNDVADFSSLPDKARALITNGWAFENAEEALEYLAKPIQSLDEVLGDLQAVSEIHRRRFLDSEEVMGLFEFLQHWRDTAKAYLRECENPSLRRLEGDWESGDVVKAFREALFELLDRHSCEGDAFIWGALQKVQTDEDRREVMLQRSIEIWSTISPLCGMLEVDVNPIDAL